MNLIEPSADARAAAVAIRGMFVAYVDVGFSPAEALVLVMAHIQSASGQGRS